jgi:hypothetical protein
MSSDFLEFMGGLFIVVVLLTIGACMERCSAKDASLGKVPYTIDGKVYKCQEQK